jgi:SAM-dependent methyltransferase
VPPGESLALLWELGELPFHVGPKPEPSNGSLPARLPFRVGFDTRSGRLVQMPDAQVRTALESAYRQGSQIGTPLSETGMGQAGLAEFLAFVERALGDERLNGLSVLEIGSGGGAMLRALHARGARVIGVEPGAGADPELPVPVLREPFSPDLFDAPFDLIIHHGVAEHVPDPAAFMTGQLSLLAEDGLIVFAVPDCAAPLEHGDISMLVHEHWSYFTEDTLHALASVVGADVIDTTRATTVGARYSAWAAADAASDPAPATPNWFVTRAAANLERLRAYGADLRSTQAPLGIYCPGRFINYQALLADDLPPLRYFDDDPLLEGRFYPPSPIPIESRAGLLAQPPAHLLIVSWTYGEQIARSLRTDGGLDGVQIQTIAGLLGA